MVTTALTPEDGFKRMVASSAAFQTAVGAANATAALAHCVSNGESDFAKARSIIRLPNGVTRKSTGIGNIVSSGTLYWGLWRKYDNFEVFAEDQPETDPGEERPPTIDVTAQDDAEKTFLDWCSTVLTEVEAIYLARTAVMGQNPLSVQSIRTTGDCNLIPASEWKRYYEIDPSLGDDFVDKCVFVQDFEVEFF